MSARFRSLLPIVLAVATLHTTRTACGQQELPIEVVAIRENAERLQSGEYRATGSLTREIGEISGAAERGMRTGEFQFEFDDERFNEYRRRRNQNAAGVSEGRSDEGDSQSARLDRYEETLESYFDFGSGRFGFRRTRVQTEGEVSATRTTRHAWYVSTPARTILVRGGQTPRLEVAIHEAGLSAAEAGRYFEPVLDPRSMGWGGFDHLGIREGPGSLVNLDASEIDVGDEGNGIRRLQRVLIMDPDNPDLPARISTWWCDEQQGYQPVRFVSRHQHLHPTTRAQHVFNESARPSDEAEFFWSKIGDVWVVETLEVRSRKGAREEHLELSFDWKFVNEPVSAERFDWENWDLPRGSRVVDMRLGEDKPIEVASIGFPGEVEVNPPVAPGGSAIPARILIIVNVIFGGVLAGFLLRRWMQQKRANGPSIR